MIGIAASGRTLHNLSNETSEGAWCNCGGTVICSPHSEMANAADISMLVEAGPEVMTGSPNEGSTLTISVKNMDLYNSSVIKIGKVYSNLMIDAQPTNEKLRIRAKAIVAEATGVSINDADEALRKYGSVKSAILAIVTGEKEKIYKKYWINIMGN